MVIKNNCPKSFKESLPSIALIIIGAILNITAMFTDGNSSLVAVGCSLTAIGIVLSSKASKKKN